MWVSGWDFFFKDVWKWETEALERSQDLLVSLSPSPPLPLSSCENSLAGTNAWIKMEMFHKCNFCTQTLLTSLVEFTRAIMWERKREQNEGENTFQDVQKALIGPTNPLYHLQVQCNLIKQQVYPLDKVKWEQSHSPVVEPAVDLAQLRPEVLRE